jgi:hypothetical protein
VEAGNEAQNGNPLVMKESHGADRAAGHALRPHTSICKEMPKNM